MFKLVEVFVIAPIGIAAAILALVITFFWWLVEQVLSSARIDIPSLPDAQMTVVRWPDDALRRIVTGHGGSMDSVAANTHCSPDGTEGAANDG